MISNIQKLALVALVMAPFGAAQAAPTIASQGYVDSGLATKQNKIEGTAGQIVTATGTAGQVTYTGVDGTVTAGSNNLITSGAVQTAIAGVVAGAVDGLGNLASLDTVSAAEIQNNAVTTDKIMDSNVTTAKLAADIQASLGRADTALQSADIAGLATETFATGAAASAAGTVQTNLDTFQNRAAGFATSAQGALADTALQSADIAGKANVADLGTAAYAATTDFDAAGSAAGVQTNLDTFQNRAAGFATSAQGALADTALQSADIANLAEKATTLAGYGITDAYTKTETDTLLNGKQDTITCPAGELLIANATGGVDCVGVATTYTGAGN
ncbi:MAG: hypothetical protein FWE52_00510 [Alphaproteobacteria bacterium]|nr:hypothetical protein [Alphaproteobacteria bacterium]